MLLLDYDSSVQDVLRDATRYALYERKDLDLLTSICHRSDTGHQSGCCSWTFPADQTYSRDGDPVDLPTFFNASAGKNLNLKSLVEPSASDINVLSLQGSTVDSVTKTGEVLAPALWEQHELSWEGERLLEGALRTVLTVRNLSRRCSANRYLYRCTCIRTNVGIECETLY